MILHFFEFGLTLLDPHFFSVLEAEYKSELERLRVELERLSPNLKAVDQLQGVAENVQAGRWGVVRGRIQRPTRTTAVAQLRFHMILGQFVIFYRHT